MSIITIKEKIYTQPFVTVGAIIKKDDKFLLVKEGQEDKGTWNRPGGWLELKEDIISAVKREVKEETGLEIKITGLLGIYSFAVNRLNKIVHPIKIDFCAKALTDKIVLPDDIMDARWFTVEEIRQMKNKLRSLNILTQIEDSLTGNVYPLDVIKKFEDYT